MVGPVCECADAPGQQRGSACGLVPGTGTGSPAVARVGCIELSCGAGLRKRPTYHAALTKLKCRAMGDRCASRGSMEETPGSPGAFQASRGGENEWPGPEWPQTPFLQT
jgi:hypothetical protein